jgi:Fe-S cluster assembly protein SufD
METTVAAAKRAGGAIERYVDQFQALLGNGAAGAPVWLKDRREQAMARFMEVGFPSARLEEWRFTDVKPITQEPFNLAPAREDHGVTSERVARYLIGSDRRQTAVFVNGHYAPDLSTAELPAGVALGSMRTALKRDPELLERHLGRYASDERNPFTALSTAFAYDGAFVHVGRNVTMEAPLQLIFVTVPEEGKSYLSHPRNLVVVEDGAEATLLETYVGLGDATYWTNAVTEVVVGENAKADTYRLQWEGAGGYHTATTHSHQGRDSKFSLVTFTFGGRLSRHDIYSVLDGEGADCTLDGLSMLRGRQHTDHHTVLEHAKPNCTSWEYFNGTFDERARGVFNGRIIVRPGAQKTDSKQTNNNLLLTEQARADSQPQLEIYADDVRCTHGATLGPIDQEHLYYIQSRGLSREEARGLLTYGFASEILNAVSLEELKHELDGVVRAWLAGSVRRRTG